MENADYALLAELNYWRYAMTISEKTEKEEVVVALNSVPSIGIIQTQYVNFEEKTLEQLKNIRTNMNIKQVNPMFQGEAYMMRMIDILLEKIEDLEKYLK